MCVPVHTAREAGDAERGEKSMIWELIGIVGVVLVAYGILEIIAGVRALEARSMRGSRKGHGRQ